MTASLDVTEAVDLSAVAAWLDRQGILGEIDRASARLLTGGTQNLLVQFKKGHRNLVLRRPSLTPRPRNNELILREATVLTALAGSGIPHAAILATCDDEAILGGAAFYVMESVEGFNPAVELPDGLRTKAATDHIAFSATDALADIGALDVEVRGLADFGKPEGFLDRQLRRWTTERENYLGLSGYPGDPLPGFDEISSYLAARVPQSFRTGLMHGDYHLGNLILDHKTGDLRAVVDWEMSTIGDPLLDLGRFLAMWPDQHEVIVETGGIWEIDRLPAPHELAERYAARAGVSLDHLNWYIVMGCYKLGVILEGTYARSCAGLVSASLGMELHRAARTLFERATRLVGGAA